MAKVVNPRAIKRKIRSVQNIKKITKAMEMVSAAKLKRVQGRLVAIRPYSNKIRELLRDLADQAKDLDVPMLKARPKVRRVAYVLFTADKGLCGSYNANVLRVAARTTALRPGETDLYAIGRKGRDFYRKRGPAPTAEWTALPLDIGFAKVREITQTVIGAYLREEVDEVHLIYTEFVNAVTFTPKVMKFLPMEPQAAVEEAKDAGRKGGAAAAQAPAGGAGKAGKAGAGTGTGTGTGTGYGYIFEPEPRKILEQLIPRYVEVLFYRVLLESMASEHGARMSAMRNATENAEELIGSLTLSYNKARQAAITKELLDIVGGAEALKG
jgi:F-type H+-transporting ATPase subunit gamma